MISCKQNHVKIECVPCQYSKLTMSVSYEDFLNFPHLNAAFLNLVLRRFATVEKPDISVDAQSQGRMISCRGRLRGCSS